LDFRKGSAAQITALEKRLRKRFSTIISNVEIQDNQTVAAISGINSSSNAGVQGNGTGVVGTSTKALAFLERAQSQVPGRAKFFHRRMAALLS
jgi:hypothetical protein